MGLISSSLNKDRWLQIFKLVKDQIKKDVDEDSDGPIGESSTSGYYIPDSDPPLDDMMADDDE